MGEVGSMKYSEEEVIVLFNILFLNSILCLVLIK